VFFVFYAVKISPPSALGLVFSTPRAIFQKPAISRDSVTGKPKIRARFPRFFPLAKPGQPLANNALSAQSAVANPSSEFFSSKTTVFRYSVTGLFPEPG